MTEGSSVKRDVAVVLAFGVATCAALLYWIVRDQQALERRQQGVIDGLRADALRKCSTDEVCIARVERSAERCALANAKYRHAGNQVREMVGVQSVARYYTCVGIPSDKH